MYFDVWRRRPVECVTSALIYRPVAFVRMLGWLGGLTRVPPYLDLVNEDGQRAFQEMHKAIATGGFAYSPLQPWDLLTLAPFIVILAPAGVTAFKATIGPGAVFLAGAFTPTILVYPYAHTMGEPAIAATMPLYGVAAVTVLFLVGRIASRYQGVWTRAAVQAVGAESESAKR
jgi:hypothetical protein